jgi:hypothetical protein
MRIALVGICLLGVIVAALAALYAFVRALWIANNVSKHIQIRADSPWFVRANPFNAFFVSSCLTPEGVVLRRKLARAIVQFLLLALLVPVMHWGYSLALAGDLDAG